MLTNEDGSRRNIGYGTARNQGKIFKPRVQFNKTYEALP